MKSFVLLLLVACPAFLAEKARFDNFKVFRVTPEDEEAIDALRALDDTLEGFSFWKEPTRVGNPVDVMVPLNLEHQFQDILTKNKYTATILVDNVQNLIDKERPKARQSTRMGWEDYRTLDEINAWLQELADTDSRVSIIKGGTTYEGRDIVGVKVVFAPGNENRGVFLESNIHAREWITNAVTTWMLNELLTSTDSNVRQVADSHDWYIFPVVNPDGYVYTHTTNRMWRKTRVPYFNCVGADPNRNWPFQWSHPSGSSSNPCSETYSGPMPFSEHNTRTFSEYIASVASKLEAYIAIHSYGQLLLIPYGDSIDQKDNYEDLYNVGVKAATSLAQRYGTEYTVGNTVEVLYIATGISMDWVKDVFKIPITYTYELRDKGPNGFVLPAAQIIPTAEETFDSLVTMFQEFALILPNQNTN